MTKELPPELKTLVERLEAALNTWDAGVQEAMDELVHEAASSMASDINDNGVEDQVRFLWSQSFDTEQLVSDLETILEDIDEDLAA